MAEFSSEIEVSLINNMGGDDAIAAAAMVSTQGDEAVALELTHEKEVGLINFLMKNRHGSPFEHGSMTFFVAAPIFVFREWHRHRAGWSYNEESGRYKQLDAKFYVPKPERALQQIGKAGAYEFVEGTRAQVTMVNSHLKGNSERAYGAYETLLDVGVAKEVARMTLPVNIYSTMYATCNPRSLMHFLSLRTKSQPHSAFKSYPMHEISVAADKMEAEFASLYPITYEAFEKNGRIAP
jgi:thymidylate synthase (FAD)